MCCRSDAWTYLRSNCFSHKTVKQYRLRPEVPKLLGGGAVVFVLGTFGRKVKYIFW
jgi:hypothetical protein